MPEAPAPIPRLSTTRMSSPLPRPRARSSRARCQAVESPWMPAPTIRYRVCVGSMAAAFPARGPRHMRPRSACVIAEREILLPSHGKLTAMARTGQPATRHVAAVQRAMAILEALAAAKGDLGTNEIARQTGINGSSISRILATLASGGLVEHLPSSGRYRLGVGIMRLAAVVGERLDIRVLARPHLEELARRTR